MSRDISDETYQRALAAAERLKSQLLAQLLNRTAPGWKCCCGGLRVKPSKVVDIEIPSYRNQVGLSYLWTCTVEDVDGARSGCGLSTFFPPEQIIPTFREAFKGIDIELNRTTAAVYGDDGRSAPRFNRSGRMLVLEEGKPVFVRPVGEPETSIWQHCELRVDGDLENHPGEKPLFACNIDALAYGAARGRGEGQYYRLPDAHLPIVTVRVSSGDSYPPIVRVLRLDGESEKVIVELDEGVEEFSIEE